MIAFIVLELIPRSYTRRYRRYYSDNVVMTANCCYL